MTFQFKITITRKRALMVIFAVISVMIIDSTIVKYISYGTKEMPTRIYVNTFVTFAMLFVGISVVLLGFIERKELGSGLRRGLALRNSNRIIFLIQFSLIAIIVIIVQSTVNLQSYSVLSVLAAIYISHIAALFFLLLLSLSLVEWIRTKRNKILLLYAVSFAVTALSIIISLIYATNVLSNQPSLINPYSIRASTYSLPRADLAIYFGPTLDIISILSFVSVWIVSVILLSTYTKKMGKARFWMISSIPLLYFLFAFESYFLNIFQHFMTSPVSYSGMSVLIFSATKQIGALFFSLAFLIAAALLGKYVIHKYLLISAVGMAILFGSIEIDSILYATYPPFGLVTISFMPIGAYFVFTGIINSAALVARDKELRKEFYKSAMSQLDLLWAIGVTEMEKQLIQSYKSVEKHVKPQEIKDRRFEKDNLREILHDVVDDLDKENVREILHEVLTEVYVKSRPKSKF